MPDTTDRPKVKLIGGDGNAFAILASCHKAARNAGWSRAQIDEFTEEATAGDYNHLLRIAMEYFEVE